MKHTIKNESGSDIACYETEDGLMNLQIGSTLVQLSKERFVEFSVMVHRVGQILIDELIEERLSKRKPIGLNA